MSELVTIDIHEHIADVRFNRPEKLNALNWAMFNAINHCLDRLSQEKAVRVVVLSGEGRGFCAGLDTEMFASPELTDTSTEDRSLLIRYRNGITNQAQRVAYGWKELPMPVIAAIHGACLGGGCQIALGADIRLATPDAKLSIRELHWGLIPDMSVSQTIRDLMPIDRAKELIYTARIVSGEEAARLHLVTRTCADPKAEAMVLAEEIAGKSPHAIRAAKHLLNTTWHGDSAGGLLLESALESTLMAKPNNREAVMANFENRKPCFTDPE
jgi:enoyl-CoA hydratase/carnithine racemase